MSSSSSRQQPLPDFEARCSVEISVQRDRPEIGSPYSIMHAITAEISMYVGNDGWTWSYRERITVAEANNFLNFFRTNQALSETLTYGTFAGIWSLITSRPFPSPYNIHANIGRGHYDEVEAVPLRGSDIDVPDAPEPVEAEVRPQLLVTRLDYGGLGI
jgi:hypothetical protein